jgi:hypothetical protein
LTDEKFRELWGIAGYCGLCDWRPSSKTPGPFGMFVATLEEI